MVYKPRKQIDIFPNQWLKCTFCVRQTRDLKEFYGHDLDFYNQIQLKIMLRLVIFPEINDWTMNGLIPGTFDSLIILF